MTDFTRRVANSNDDGVKRGSLSWDVGFTYIGDDSFFGDFITGVRFNNVTVPNGATITSAKLTFRPSANSAYNYYLKVYGIDEDDTADLSSDPTGRTKTTASVDWDHAGFTANTDIDTPDIKTIIQEIVNRAGWSSGNDMGFLILDDGGSSHYAQMYDYVDSTSYCALLTISYTTGSESASISSSPSVTPSVSMSGSKSPSPSVSVSASVSPSLPEYGFGIKISKSGYDAKTEMNPENLIFTSAFGALGWRSTVDIEGTTDANGKIEAEYTHNLGYIPMIFVYVTNNAGQKIAVPSKWESTWDADETLEENFYWYVYGTKIYVKAYSHHYQPIMGGTDTALVGTTYTFQAIIYFNEMNDEY